MIRSIDQADLQGEVMFLDVGQGDATLVIDHGSKNAVLIDCPAGQERVVEAALDQSGSRLDTVIITHWDIDHFGGVLSLVGRRSCRRIMYNHDTLIAHGKNSTIMATLRRFLDDSLRHVQLAAAEAGFSDEIGCLKFELLAPSHAQLTQAVASSDRNLASGVVKICVASLRVLIGGDADGRVWRRLLDAGVDLEVDILKWPHHGGLGLSASNVDAPRLVTATRPGTVIFSVGSANRYNHPMPDAIHAVTTAGAEAVCTEATPQCHSAAVRGTRCAGTVAVRVYPSGLHVRTPTVSDHRAVVDGWSSPVCRAVSASLAQNLTSTALQRGSNRV